MRWYLRMTSDILGFVQGQAALPRSFCRMMLVRAIGRTDKVIEAPKSLNRLPPDNLCQVFSRLSDVHNWALRNIKCDLAIPQMRTAHGQKLSAFRGADAWNKLHYDVKLASSIQSFKTKYKAHI